MFLRMMKIKTLLLAAALTASAGLTAAESSDTIKAAIFMRNNGGLELSDKIDTFNDRLSARLTEKGFGILDFKSIVQKFREANAPEEQIFKDVKTVMGVATTTRTNSSLTGLATNDRQQNETELVEQGRAGAVAQASSLRVAQMLDADFIIIASMGQLGHEKRTFKGEGTIYKTDNTVDLYTMPLTIKVLDGATGQSVYGDTLTASYKVNQNASLQIQQNNIVDNLLDSGSAMLSDNISSNVERIRKAAKQAAASVPFSVQANIEGVSVELDGVSIGSAPGNFKARPGLHQLRVSREYFQTWERTVNVAENQKFDVALELSESGLAKYKDITAFKQAQELEKAERLAKIDIAKEQSKADVDVKEKLSSGGEVFLKNSYIRSDGFAQQLMQVIHGR